MGSGLYFEDNNTMNAHRVKWMSECAHRPKKKKKKIKKKNERKKKEAQLILPKRKRKPGNHHESSIKMDWSLFSLYHHTVFFVIPLTTNQRVIVITFIPPCLIPSYRALSLYSFAYAMTHIVRSNVFNVLCAVQPHSVCVCVYWLWHRKQADHRRRAEWSYPCQKRMERNGNRIRNRKRAAHSQERQQKRKQILSSQIIIIIIINSRRIRYDDCLFVFEKQQQQKKKKKKCITKRPVESALFDSIDAQRSQGERGKSTKKDRKKKGEAPRQRMKKG